MIEKFALREDCRYYKGDKPCKPGKICPGCPDYERIEQRLCIVKLAAAGDVLRTTPLLRALKKIYPRSWITWITDPESRILLDGNPLIDEVVVFNAVEMMQLAVRKFEWAAILDKEPRAAVLGTMINSARKIGFGMDDSGRLTILNPESSYALRLGLDDRLKFHENRKTYHEITFEMCGLNYRDEEYVYNLSKKAVETGRNLLARAGWRPGKITIGLNTGCGDIFATKKWTEEGFIKLAEDLVRRMGFQIVLLGGPDESERNRAIKEKLTVPVVDTGVDNPLDVFAGLIDGCRLLVTADTLALHLAIALKKEVVLLMGPTASAEIELFGRGEIIEADLECAPCYKQTCPEGGLCMSSISAEVVLEAVARRIDCLESGRSDK